MSGNGRPVTAVIMSVYGGDMPEWFQLALDSLRGQTYPADKVHIYLGVDGPIGLALDAVIEANRGLFHKVIQSPVNIHLCGIMNLLIRNLDAEEYVFRMDSDDICEPGRFEAQVAFMEAHRDIGVLGTPILEFDTQAAWSRIRYYPVKHEELASRMHLGLPFAHPTVCIRRESLDRMGGYSMASILNQDVELWFRALSMGIRFANLEEPQLRFRSNLSMLARRTRAKSWNELILYIQGCYKIYGISYRMLFPFLRYLLRLMPMRVIQASYSSNIRHRLLAGKVGGRTGKEGRPGRA